MAFSELPDNYGALPEIIILSKNFFRQFGNFIAIENLNFKLDWQERRPIWRENQNENRDKNLYKPENWAELIVRVLFAY